MKRLKYLLLALCGLILPVAAVPMPNPAIITTNDSFDIGGVVRGKTQDLILKGTFGGATVALQYQNQATGAWDTVQSWTAATDFVHLAQGPTARLTVSGGSAMSINVTFFQADPLAKRSGTFTGPVTATRYLADNNTAAAPAYSFTGETGTGWYLAAPGDLRASILGTDRMSITSLGTQTSALLTDVWAPTNAGSQKIRPVSAVSSLGEIAFSLSGQITLTNATDATSGGAGSIITPGGIYSAKSQYTPTTMTAGTSLNSPILKGTGTSLSLQPNAANTTGQITVNTAGDVAVSSTTAAASTSNALAVAGGISSGGGVSGSLSVLSSSNESRFYVNANSNQLGMGSSGQIRFGNTTSASGPTDVALTRSGPKTFLIADGGSGPGSILSAVTVQASTAGVGSPKVLTVTESAKVVTNEGASAQAYNMLPSAAQGLTFTFICQNSNGIRATANTGNTIRMAGTVSASAGYIRSSVTGSTLTLVAINSTEWYATASMGTWTIDS